MNKIKLLFVAFCISIGFFFIPGKANAQSVNINFSVFQQDLGRFGRWVHSPKYGQVWIYTEPGFRPYYTNGHWEYTSYGWAWVSDYEWGWAPFHYGRWEMDPFYGWIWIPGYEWAPAWVSWSEYNGYYGWAPLGFGLSINVSFGSIPYDRWMFAPRQHIFDRSVRNYCLPSSRNTGFRNAVVINNIYVNNNTRFMAGPRRLDVERYSRTKIEVRNIDRGRPNRIVYNDRNDRRPNVIERPQRIEQRSDRPDRIEQRPQQRMERPNRIERPDRPQSFPQNEQRRPEVRNVPRNFPERQHQERRSERRDDHSRDRRDNRNGRRG